MVEGLFGSLEEVWEEERVRCRVVKGGARKVEAYRTCGWDLGLLRFFEGGGGSG